MEGIGHIRPVNTLADWGATPIFLAKGHDWPAVVLASLDQVQLVPTLWAMLMGHQLAAIWMNGQALKVSMTEAVDVAQRPRLIHKWVVDGRSSIALNSYDLAEM